MAYFKEAYYNNEVGGSQSVRRTVIRDSILAVLQTDLCAAPGSTNLKALCEAALGTEAAYIQQYKTATGKAVLTTAEEQELKRQYQQNVQFCAVLSPEKSNLIASKRILMLLDMEPLTGQYGRAVVSGDNMSLYNTWNVLYGTAQRYKTPLAELGANYYYDVSGVISPIS